MYMTYLEAQGTVDYTPTYNWGITPISPLRGIISRVIRPVISSYKVQCASKYVHDIHIPARSLNS